MGSRWLGSRVLNRLIRHTKTLFREEITQELVECRHCGTTVDEPKVACPNCGSQEWAHYKI